MHFSRRSWILLPQAYRGETSENGRPRQSALSWERELAFPDVLAKPVPLAVLVDTVADLLAPGEAVGDSPGAVGMGYLANAGNRRTAQPDAPQRHGLL
jgi:hypothetical protein